MPTIERFLELPKIYCAGERGHVVRRLGRGGSHVDMGFEPQIKHLARLPRVRRSCSPRRGGCAKIDCSRQTRFAFRSGRGDKLTANKSITHPPRVEEESGARAAISKRSSAATCASCSPARSDAFLITIEATDFLRGSIHGTRINTSAQMVLDTSARDAAILVPPTSPRVADIPGVAAVIAYDLSKLKITCTGSVAPVAPVRRARCHATKEDRRAPANELIELEGAGQNVPPGRDAAGKGGAADAYWRTRRTRRWRSGSLFGRRCMPAAEVECRRDDDDDRGERTRTSANARAHSLFFIHSPRLFVIEACTHSRYDASGRPRRRPLVRRNTSIASAHRHVAVAICARRRRRERARARASPRERARPARARGRRREILREPDADSDTSEPTARREARETLRGTSPREKVGCDPASARETADPRASLDDG